MTTPEDAPSPVVTPGTSAPDAIGGDVTWDDVIESAHVLGVDPVMLVAAARYHSVSPEFVMDSYRRSLLSEDFYRVLGIEPSEGDEDAIPPGHFDIRILDQSEVWIDILGRIRRIDNPACMGDWELGTVAGALIHHAEELSLWWHEAAGVTPSTDGRTWIETTPLVGALLAELDLRGAPVISWAETSAYANDLVEGRLL